MTGRPSYPHALGCRGSCLWCEIRKTVAERYGPTGANLLDELTILARRPVTTPDEADALHAAITALQLATEHTRHAPAGLHQQQRDSEAHQQFGRHITTLQHLLKKSGG